jgi:hypothetical protein
MWILPGSVCTKIPSLNPTQYPSPKRLAVGTIKIRRAARMALDLAETLTGTQLQRRTHLAPECQDLVP